MSSNAQFFVESNYFDLRHPEDRELLVDPKLMFVGNKLGRSTRGSNDTFEACILAPNFSHVCGYFIGLNFKYLH